MRGGGGGADVGGDGGEGEEVHLFEGGRSKGKAFAGLKNISLRTRRRRLRRASR